MSGRFTGKIHRIPVLENCFNDEILKSSLDKNFGIAEYQHELLCEPLYIVVWLDTKEQIPKTGAFLSLEQAESYTKEHRKQLIDQKFEELFLSNK